MKTMLLLFLTKRLHVLLLSLVLFISIAFFGHNHFFNQTSIAYATNYPGDYNGTLNSDNNTVTGNVTGDVSGAGNTVYGDVLRNVTGNNNKIWGNVKGILSGGSNEAHKDVSGVGSGNDNIVWGNVLNGISGNNTAVCNNASGLMNRDSNTIWGSFSGNNTGSFNIIKNMGGGQGPCTLTSPPTRPTLTPLPPTATPIQPTSTPTFVPSPTTPQPTYTIRGAVFNDSNKNGRKDVGESNYSGTPGISASRGTVATNADGSYTISNLSAGLVTISYMSLPQGFNMTSPHNGPPPSFQVTVGPGCDTNTANGARCQ